MVVTVAIGVYKGADTFSVTHQHSQFVIKMLFTYVNMLDRLVIFVVSEQHVVRPRVPMIYDVELVVLAFQRPEFLVKYLVGEFLNFV